MQTNSEHTLLSINETLPQTYSVKFEEIKDSFFPKVRVTLDGMQSGDIVDDNSFENDGYRFHDVFHYTFATLLGWSPCVRSMLKRKRKSDKHIDRVEDGARAAITEECISLMIFCNAKQNNFYKDTTFIDNYLLDTIKNMTRQFEVKSRTTDEWQQAILKSYEMFRLLNEHGGGTVNFDAINKSVSFSKS